MSRSEQLSLTRERPALEHRPESSAAPSRDLSAIDVEASARRALRGQIARLERELSALVAEGFPGIAAAGVDVGGGRATSAPRLLSLAELERDRDALVGSVRQAQASAETIAERHRAGRELLAAMQLEPARYKFVRLRAVDVGERGCGVWEVRPRLGVIGMLAGWWRVKLSSGCPLTMGRAGGRGPRRGASVGQTPEASSASHGLRARVARTAASIRTSARR
jgi:hypothetical protein